MTNNKIKVLSLFDGIAGCRQALKELNIDCDYYASEIDKYAIKVANHNHPDIVQIGDVKSCDFKQFKDIDLLSAGFPCQSYSMAGNRKGIEDERGQLIYDVFRALKDCKPKYFLLENVKGLLSIDKGETFKNILKDLVDCGYIVNSKVINSALVTAQNRQRVYIIGSLEEKIEIEDPEDKGIYLKDIVEDIKQCKIMATQLGNSKKWGNSVSDSGKAYTLRARQPNGVIIDQNIRKLTPNECCRLQGFPDGYCDSVSKTQGYKGLGNSFTVPIIKHLIKQILK